MSEQAKPRTRRRVKPKSPAPSKGVPVTLDRKRYLRYSLKALSRIADNKGFSLQELLHIGLVGDDPKLTPDKVGELVDLESLPELQKALKQATGGMIDLDKLFKFVAGEDDAVDPPKAKEKK